MANCPFAVWMPLDGSPGAYVRGHSLKIVHHTTGGSSADGAFAIYRTRAVMTARDQRSFQFGAERERGFLTQKRKTRFRSAVTTR